MLQDIVNNKGNTSINEYVKFMSTGLQSALQSKKAWYAFINSKFVTPIVSVSLFFIFMAVFKILYDKEGLMYLYSSLLAGLGTTYFVISPKHDMKASIAKLETQLGNLEKIFTT